MGAQKILDGGEGVTPEVMLDSALGEGQKRLILGDNARRLLRLPAA